MMILAFMVLILLTVGALGYALMYKSISSQQKSNQRMKSLQVDKKTKVKAQAKRVDEKQRRKARENTLKNVAEQRSAGKKAASPALATRLVQAGMTMTTKTFYIICAVCSVLAFLVALIVGAPLYVAAGAGVVGGLGLPRLFVNFKRARRFKAFTLIFPNAIDIIVRGIRSGLPLNDCLRIIAQDSEEPVRSEFRKLVESTQLGVPVPEACERLYDSIPTSETNFFAIVIAIQSSAGGNLSEALSNLSKVLRERRKLADKIKALSTEAKTSAGIIGSLPFAVGLAVSLIVPGYLDALWETKTGHNIILFIVISMGMGIAIMKKMIAFKF